MRRGLLAFLATLQLGLGGCIRAGYSESNRQSGSRGDAGFALDGGGLFASDGNGPGLYPVGRYPFGPIGPQVKPTGAYVLQDAGMHADLDAGADAGAPADPMLGIWSVQRLTDRTSTTYDACMTITQVSQSGSMTGPIVYSNGLDCIGYLTFQSVSGGVYTFYEYITAGANQAFCNVGGGGRVETSVLSSDSIEWDWYRRTGTNSVATGVFDRVSACP